MKRRYAWTEGYRFLLVGVVTVCVDYTVYQLGMKLGLEINFAKGVGFICGAIFAYITNRFWTFMERKVGSGSVWRFGIVYGINLALNVLINSFLFDIFYLHKARVFGAFFIATVISAILNFLGMKFYVFADRSSSK